MQPHTPNKPVVNHHVHITSATKHKHKPISEISKRNGGQVVNLDEDSTNNTNDEGEDNMEDDDDINDAHEENLSIYVAKGVIKGIIKGIHYTNIKKKSKFKDNTDTDKDSDSEVSECSESDFKENKKTKSKRKMLGK